MKKPVAGTKERVISAKGMMPKKRETSKIGMTSKAFGISADVTAKFRVWFERNLAGFRSGVVGGVEYRRAGALDDRPGDASWYANAYDRAVLDYTESATPAEDEFILSHPLIVLQLLLGLTDLRGIRCMRRGLTRRINALQQKSYRSRYYEKDNYRRRALAAARRKINRRTTLNPCPTPDEFRAAFAARNDSVEARIRFGGMVHDLECYVDNCLRVNQDGEIVGRNGGIKYWIGANVPELYGRYKTIMRYKALARRVRQAVMAVDPVPTSDLLVDELVVEMKQGGDTAEKVAGETPMGGDVGRVAGMTPLGGAAGRALGDAAEKVAGEMQFGDDVRRVTDEPLMGNAARRVVSETPVRKTPPSEASERKRSWGEVEQIENVGSRDSYYAMDSHEAQRKVAVVRVRDIFEGCANTMVGVFRAVDGYMDTHYDEFCGFVEGLSDEVRNWNERKRRLAVSDGEGTASRAGGKRQLHRG